jgi:hypothetical protein
MLQNLENSLAAREYWNAALGARRRPVWGDPSGREVAEAELEALRRNCRIAFLHQLPKCDETALAPPYNIGRSAVVDGTRVLVRTRIHHEILRESSPTPAPTRWIT